MPPWEKYAQPAAASQGDPVIARDPYKINAESRAAEDQRLQQAAAARAEEDQRMQRAKFEEDARQREADRAAGVNTESRESENKAASFLIRALGANKGYESTGIGPRSLVGQKVADVAPNVLNSLPGMIGNSDARQVADSTQDEFIAASLRQDSGAAIPPEEMDRQRRIYFPMPGDSETVIEQKRQARLRAIEGLKMSAGRLEGEAEKRFSELSAATPGGTIANNAEYDKDGYYVGLAGGVTDESAPPPPSGPSPSPSPEEIALNKAEGSPGWGTIAEHGITLGLSDEAAGIGGFIGGMLTGQNPLTEYQRMNERQDRRVEAAREDTGAAGTALEFIGGGAGAKVAAVPNSLWQAARTGGGIGAVAGYGYGEGAVGSAGNALLGGLAGGALGAGGQWAVNALAARSAARAGERAIDPEILAAGERRQVPVRAPDVRKDMRLRRSELRGSQSAGQRVRDAEIEDIAAVESAVDRDLGGAAANRVRAGDAAQEGVQAARQGMRDKASRHYDRAHALSGRARIAPEKAIEAIDRNIAELSEAGTNSNKSLIKYLNDVKDDLSVNGGMTVEALRNQRTNMRGQIGERNLSMTDAERRMGQVLDAAADDIGSGLAGRPEALKEFRAGDAIWRDRARFTKQIGERLLGPKNNPFSPDQTASRLESWASSDFRRFRDTWARLDSAAQSDIRSHIAGNLGRNQRGDFSLEFFLKHTGAGKGSVVSDRTARLVFGEDGMSAIKDLRALSRAKVEAGSATNRSETSTAMKRTVAGLRHVLLTGLGFSMGDFTGAVAAPLAGGVIARLGEQRAARMLLNPDFTKWLRNAPNTANPRAIDRYFGRLGSVPSIAANDNAAFQQAIRGAFGQSPTVRAAAEEQNSEER